MNSIIFIETYKSGSSRQGVRTAKMLGFKIHLLTSSQSILEQKEQYPEVDEMYLVNTKNAKEVEEIIFKITAENSVACIVSFIDSFVHMAANFSNQFCRTKLSANSFKIMEDKLLTREQLKDKEYSLYYFILREDRQVNQFILNFSKVLHVKFPLIVKLPKSAGSKDVYLVNSITELKNRLNFYRSKFPKAAILIEEFIDGPQVIVEAIVHNGEIHISAIVEQQITKGEKFIVTGYSISNEIEEEFKDSLIQVTKDIITETGLENGNCHLELRRKGDNWKLIEANPRIAGGVMNKLISEAYGYNYAEQILQVYLGKNPVLNKTKEVPVYAHYLTVKTKGKLLRITGRNRAQKVSGVVEVFIKPKRGKILSPPLSMGHRYGYVLAKGTTKDEAKNIALKAANQIKFSIEPMT